MKIAIFVHCFYPNHIYGTEAYTLAIAQGLQRLGHEVTVVSTVFPGESPQTAFIEAYEWQGVPVLSIDKNFRPHQDITGTYYQADMRPVLERVLRKLDPDVVYVTHLIGHTAALLEVCTAMSLRVHATLTDFFGFCLNNKLESASGMLCAGPSKSGDNCVACYARATSEGLGDPVFTDLTGQRRINARLDNLYYRRDGTARIWVERIPQIKGRANLLREQYSAIRSAIAPSTFLLDAYRRNMPSLNLKLSHFGIDIDRRPKPRRANDVLKFGYIGQIAPHKGVHLLIRAFNRLASGTAALEIWGPLSQDADYVKMLTKESEGRDIRFMGTFAAEETAAKLAGIDVIVVPSTWYENSPLILLQALASHTPAIVSDVLGMTEFVTHGVNGHHFKRGSVDALHDCMNEYVSDQNLKFELSAMTAYERTTADMVVDVNQLISN